MRGSEWRYAAIRRAFDVLAATRMTALVRRLSRARGVIFTAHRVLPGRPDAFAPNAILQITPDFLEQVIVRVRELGFEIVDLDEALRRIESPVADRRFVVFSFDDAYRDNLEYALPVLRRHACPFTLYVPTALVDGAGEVWWQALEDLIAAGSGTVADKRAAYRADYERLLGLPEDERVDRIRTTARSHGLDLAAHCRELIMTWDEVQRFADEPLCTIGAHTVHHYRLSNLGRRRAADEIASSIDVLAERLGTRPRHLSYPLGGPDAASAREYALADQLGLRSAVTTIPGGLYHRHREQLTALPRVSLNGRYQARRYVDVFATPALFTAARRL